MTQEAILEEITQKCAAFREAQLWPTEARLRSRAWLNNFDADDKWLAARLLDRFTFHSEEIVSHLFSAAYHSLCDGLPKGPSAPDSRIIRGALHEARFTLVTGEEPNPTDSGYLFCRLARQRLGIPEERFVSHQTALRHAQAGGAVIFIDDFVGSGQQFVTTWTRSHADVGGLSFSAVQAVQPFVAAYLNLVALESGLDHVYEYAPKLAVSGAHILERRSTVWALVDDGAVSDEVLDAFLEKYRHRLAFTNPYMNADPAWQKYGFKDCGLLLAFSHSVPDATLPIFWCDGPQWTPLFRRS